MTRIRESRNGGRLIASTPAVSRPFLPLTPEGRTFALLSVRLVLFLACVTCQVIAVVAVHRIGLPRQGISFLGGSDRAWRAEVGGPQPWVTRKLCAGAGCSDAACFQDIAARRHGER